MRSLLESMQGKPWGSKVKTALEEPAHLNSPRATQEPSACGFEAPGEFGLMGDGWVGTSDGCFVRAAMGASE